MKTGEPDPSADLLRRWQDDGDPEALAQLLQIEVRLLKHMIHGRRYDAASASAATSDIAQEAVLGLLKTKKKPTFTDPRALRGYLWRSAWNLLVRRFDKKQRMPFRVDVDEPAGLDRFMKAAHGLGEMDREERGMAIGLAMNLLKAEDRELIRLVYFEGKDIAAAGAALGLTRDAANSRLVRARRQLAARLTEWADLIS
jgi:RNA polymerase sigma factor (sigma-70 family)